MGETHHEPGGIPCCLECKRQLRLLAIVPVAMLIGPWVLLTAMSMIPPLIPDIPIFRLVVVAAILNGLAYLPLAYRYWRSRPVRLRVIDESTLSFAIRHEGFARETAALNEVELDSSWGPSHW